MIRSTATKARNVAWLRVVKFVAATGVNTIRLGSQSEPIPVYSNAIFPAPRGTTFDEVELSGPVGRFEWSDTHEDMP